MKKTLDKKYFNQSLTYNDYRDIIPQLLSEGKVTGSQQSEELTQIARLNWQRMQRIEKAVVLLPEMKAIIEKIDYKQKWALLTESWCGDAAQIVPVVYAMSKLNENIELHILLRDDNLELMDQYLVHGKSRSIPRLIVVNGDTMEEVFNWGPRPAILQAMMNEWVADEVSFEEMKEELHLWYAKDKTVNTQKELMALFESS